MPKELKEILPSTSFLNLPIPPSWKAQDQLNAYESWVYTAINAIAHEVASIEFKLYKKVVKGGEVDYQEVYEHEALSLLDGVNPYSCKYIHLFETVAYLELLGEAYWAIIRDARKRPVSMWQIRPDRITIVPSEYKLIDHYNYRVGGEEFRLEPEDVIPFRFMNPSQPYRGKSPVQSASMAIDTDKFSADWNRKFFYNGALPNMMITTDQNLSQQQVDRLIRVWQNKFQGKDNAHKVAFLTAGFKPNPIGQNTRDMDFAEQRRSLRDEILGIFKVPKTVIGLTEDVNRANAEATNTAFIQRTIKPIVVMLTSYLNEFYIKMWGDDSLFFDFVDPSPEDAEAKLKLYENGLKNGWMTINEVREKENLDPVEGGDVIYLPFGMSPLGKEQTEPESTPENPDEENPDTSDDENTDDDVDTDDEKRMIKLNVIKSNKKITPKFNIDVPHKSLSKLREEKVEQEIKSDIMKLVQLAMDTKPVRKTIEQKEQEFRSKYWYKMIEKTDVEEAFMKEMLKDLFIRQENEVMQKLGNIKSLKRMTRKIASRDLLFDLDDWNQEFKNKFSPFIKRIVEERALEILMLVGGRGLDMTTQNVLEFLNREGLVFIKQLNETTRDRLLDELSKGIKEGEGVEALSRRIQKVYHEADKSRSETIARTEVLRATNFATQVAYDQSGRVQKKEWLTEMDDVACEYCVDLDGKQVELTKDFSSPAGKVPYPPLHPRCRCTTIPVLEEMREYRPKKISSKDINKAIEKKVLLLSKLTDDIETTTNDITKAKEQAEIIKDEILKQAEVEKQQILEEVRKNAEVEKVQVLKDLKDLRYKVEKAVKNAGK